MRVSASSFSRRRAGGLPGLRAIAGRLLPVLALGFLLVSGAPVRAAETLTFRADYWCPYNCYPTEGPPGYMIEIAKAVLEPAGFAIDYQMMAYDEAIEAARAGTIAVVVGAAQKDAPDLLYTERSMGFSTYAFASHKGSGFAYSGVDSLKGKRLGVIQDYTYDDALDAHIAAGDGIVTVSGETATKDLVSLLADKKADVILEGDAVLEYTINQMHLTGLFDLAVASDGAPVYLAVSPSHPRAKEIVALLDQGIKELRTSGALTTILKKYGLRDWEKK